MRVISISVPKTGSHILRRVLGLENEGGIKVRDPSHIHYSQLREHANDRRLWGHVWHEPFTTIEIRRQRRQIWLLTRDPRDTIVSRYYFQKRLGNNRSYEECLGWLSLHMRKTRPWEDEDVEIFRFEELILDPEGQAQRISKLLKEPEEEVLENLLYRGGPTYRPGGGIGTYKKDFPDELWPAYKEKYTEVRHWEYETNS